MKTTALCLRTAFAITALCALSTPAALSQSLLFKAFSVTDLGQVETLGGLNNKSDVSVVGVHRISSSIRRGFLFRPSIGIRDLVPSNSNASDPIATGVNTTAFTNDTIIGTDRSQAAFLFSQSVGAAPIPMAHAALNGGLFNGDLPLAINDSGVSVGVTNFLLPDVPGNWRMPTRWIASGANTTVALLNTGGNLSGTPFPIPGSARDINSAGAIVGEVNQRACLFREGQSPLLLAASGSAANGISDNGFIAGFMPDGSGAMHAFIKPANSAIQLVLLPNFALFATQRFVASWANRINSAGIAAGSGVRADGVAFAFLWRLGSGGGWADLNTVSVLPGGVLLTEAVDINDRGDVLCYGLINGQKHGFLLRPNGSPLTFRQF